MDGWLVSSVIAIGLAVIGYALKYPRAYERLFKPILLVVPVVVMIGGAFDAGQYMFMQSMEPTLSEAQVAEARDLFQENRVMTVATSLSLLGISWFVLGLLYFVDATHRIDGGD